jgi:hypothetical protein
MEPANASDRKSIRRQEKAAAIADRSRREVIAEIMSSRPGRSWLWDILSSCSIFHTTFNGDALAGAFSEGRRSMGLALLADIMAHCPDQFILAMREHNERHHSNDRSPDLNPAADNALAERSSSPLADGGDSGASTDSGETSDADDPNYASPGRDIYIEAR